MITFNQYFDLLMVLIVGLGVAFLSWRVNSMVRKFGAIEDRLSAISNQMSSLDRSFAKGFASQDIAIADTVRKMQAEVKSLELQLRDSGHSSRENPETVEVAIRLVHEGLESDQIIARTGLAPEVVESIMMFHGGRQ